MALSWPAKKPNFSIMGISRKFRPAMVHASQSVDPAGLAIALKDEVIRQRRRTRSQQDNGHTHQAGVALSNFFRALVRPTGALWR
jgi:hypothetical protein